LKGILRQKDIKMTELKINNRISCDWNFCFSCQMFFVV